MKNEYIPYPAVIEAIQIDSSNTKTFKVRFKDKRIAKSFVYQPGQFAEISVPGEGEAPISIASSPLEKGFLEFTIRQVGRVTQALHKLKTKEIIYLRGPYGNYFAYEEMKGRNLYFLAGGMGLAPLRSLITTVFKQRGDFAKIKILYGAKTPDEFCFKEELKAWKQLPDIEVWLTVDQPDKNWKENVGAVITLCDKAEMDAAGSAAFVCGPPLMIKFSVQRLQQLGFKEQDIYMSLERYMKCGIGKCGHCNIGGRLVCIDGPVFNYSQLRKFPEKEAAIA